MDIIDIKNKLLEIKSKESNRIFGIPNKNSESFLYTDIILALTNYLDDCVTIRERINFILTDYYELFDESLSIIYLMEKFVLKSNNAICNRIHTNYFIKLKTKIINDTSYLCNDATLSQRWYHIKNNTTIIPDCIICGKQIQWNNKYSLRCSQSCWNKSDENINRLSLNKPPEWTDERKEKHKLARTGLTWDNTQKKKHSIRMRGNKNFLKNGRPWNYKLPPHMQPAYGQTRVGLKGILSPSYGKSPSKYAGFGIRGYFNNIWFRSSLELFFLIYCFNKNLVVSSAEGKLYRVDYEIGGLKKTYCPDFVVNGIIYEVKPYYKINDIIIQTKFNKLVDKFKNCILFTEYNMQPLIISLDMSIIDKFIDNKLLSIADKEYIRLKSAIYESQRSIKRYANERNI